MPMKAPYSAGVFDWTGFYLGAYAGVSAQQSREFSPTVPTNGALDHTGSGFTGGATAGYNFQFAPNWVAGIEGDIGAFRLSHKPFEWNDGTDAFNAETSSLTTLRGRLGYSNGPTLNYITGGGAWMHLKDSGTNNIFSGSVSQTKSGYAAGGGTETMLGGNWTAKAEYLFVDVGAGKQFDFGGDAMQTDHRFQTMRFGVNYLFGGKAQAALPAHNWSGFYGGIVGGSALADVEAKDPRPSTDPDFASGAVGNNGTGLTAGGILGYNWQFSPSGVAGVEADFSYLGISRGRTDLFDFTGGRNAKLTIDTNWLATLRGRLGYSTGPALLYVTGGAAWVDLKDSWQGTSANNLGNSVSSSKTLSGWTAGGGIETVLADNWTSRSEYLYVDVGNGDALTSTAAGGLFPTTMQADHKFHIFRTSLTYNFATQ